MVAEDNEKVNEKKECKAVKGIDEWELHDKAVCEGKMGPRGYKDKPRACSSPRGAKDTSHRRTERDTIEVFGFCDVLTWARIVPSAR